MGLETLAIGSLVASGLSAGVGAFGAMSTASAQADAARYQSQVARNNQIVADQNAQRTAAAGAVRAQARDMKTRALVGSIEAAQGASGLDLASPTLSDVRESAEQIGRLDSETIYNDAIAAARGQQAQGVSYGAQAGLYDMQASNAGTAGTIGSFSSLLSGASSFSDKWLKFQNYGVPGFA